MSEELKPIHCPFCRSDLTIVSSRTINGWKFVYCQDCLAEGPAKDDEAEAIAAWNRRAQDVARSTLTDEQRKLINEAIYSITQAADGIKAGCACGDEWPDADDKAFYDAELALVDRLRSMLAASPAAPVSNEDIKSAFRQGFMAGWNGERFAVFSPRTPAAPAVAPAPSDELASMTRMFNAACADLGAINEALGLDPNDGGAEPILDAIAELKRERDQWVDANYAAPAQASPDVIPITGYGNNGAECKLQASVVADGVVRVELVEATPAQAEQQREPASSCDPADICAGCRCKYNTYGQAEQQGDGGAYAWEQVVEDARAALATAPIIPAECDVRKILLRVVPGDGDGLEIYAKNVAEVEKLLCEMGERLEDFESRATAPTMSDSHAVAWENPSTHAILRDESPDMGDLRRREWRALVYRDAAPTMSEADKRDAQRYRFIKSQMQVGAVQTKLPLYRTLHWIGYEDCNEVRDADAAVDAAIDRANAEGEKT